MRICRLKSPRPGGYFDLKGLRAENKILEKEMNKPDFWQDQKRAKIISQKNENLKEEIQQWDQIDQKVSDLLELAKTAQKEKDLSWEKELEKDLKTLNKEFEKLEFFVLFSAKLDKNNAILALHAGTGGVEAQDWAQMLLRMYLRYCEAKGFTAKIIDQNRGQEAGIKSASIEVLGRYGYGNLK